MKKLLHYAGEIWRVVSPLFIFWGVTAAVVSVFGILWIIFGRYLTFLYSYEEDVMLLLSGVAALLAAWILWKIDEREGIWYGEIRKKLPVQAVLPCIGAAVGASVAGKDVYKRQLIACTFPPIPAFSATWALKTRHTEAERNTTTPILMWTREFCPWEFWLRLPTQRPSAGRMQKNE